MAKMESSSRRPAKGVVFRGEPVTPVDQERIRKLVKRYPAATRTELARRVCKLFGWKRPNGCAPERGCATLLARLERMGVLVLPPATREGPPRGSRKPVLVEEKAGCGIAYSGKPLDRRDQLTVRLLEEGEVRGWQSWMARYHYLGDCQLVGESLRYLALLGEEPAALLSWGAASLYNEPRDRHIGWSPEAKTKGMAYVAGNIRFLMLPWARVPNLASRVLSANLRRLSADWEQTYGHGLLLAETFVDVSRFSGVCYRASNWRYEGMTKGFSKQGASYSFHGQPKAVFLRPLRRGAIERLRTGRPIWDKRGANKETEMRTLARVELPLDGNDGLFALLDTIRDPRKARGIRYPLSSFLAVAVCGVMSGAKGFTAICEWAMDQPRDYLRRLRCTRGKAPSERQLRRIFDLIDAEEFDRKVGNWLAKLTDFDGAGLAIDGKTVRGSGDGEDGKPIHLLSAMVSSTGQVVAQTLVDKKTNEITKVKPLLDGLDISGAVVTADALLTQREIARHLVEEKNADYVLVVKDNQPTMRQDIADLFAAEEEKAKRQSQTDEKPRSSEAFPPSGGNGR